MPCINIFFFFLLLSLNILDDDFIFYHRIALKFISDIAVDFSMAAWWHFDNGAAIFKL